MAIRHNLELSVTEPNNEVGNLKIRQGDEQTQTLVVQITENGIAKPFTGLQPFFCAKLGQTAGLGIVEQKVIGTMNPANGTLEYVMQPEDWQQIGRQTGYFSFRKMKNAHEWTEQFSTRDFAYNVIPSAIGEIREVKKDGSTYVWTIEDMLRLFKEYIATGKTDWENYKNDEKVAWEKFVEDNREFLENADPGGKIILELLGGRGGFDSLGERLDEFVKKEGKNYFVGATQKYKSITSAYNKWISDGKPIATIWIGEGEYSDSIRALNLENKLSFVGEGKYKTVWRTTSGYYKDSPLHACNFYMSGITMIADYSDNPNFVYKTLAGASVWIDEVGGAYGLHVDFTGVGGKTTLENCDIISYQNSGVGSGTSKDQTIELINTNVYSYTPKNWHEEVAKNGGMLYHTSATSGQTNQKLKLNNSKIFSENYKALQYEVYANENVSSVEFVNCNFSSNVVFGEDLVNFAYPTKPNNVTTNSYGNNVGKCNKSAASQMIGANGHCYRSKNFNNEKTGFFWGHGGQGDLNTPGAAYFVCQSISYDDSFILQFAYSITSRFMRYIRYKNQNGWTDWTLSDNNFNDYMTLGADSNAVAIDDANNAIKTGYYTCSGSNLPTQASYVIHVISSNAQYKLQQATALTSGVTYKRMMMNGAWQAWQLI